MKRTRVNAQGGMYVEYVPPRLSDEAAEAFTRYIDTIRTGQSQARRTRAQLNEWRERLQKAWT